MARQDFPASQQAGGDDLFGLRPRYRASDGREGTDPLALAGPHPRFSLGKLSLNLSHPAIVGEFAPDCPWQGVARLRCLEPWPRAQSQAGEICARFRQAVTRAMGDAGAVAVTFSGGLDSTAVLYHAGELCRREGRRLIALTADLLDDTGVSCASVARQLIDQLQVRCELQVVDGVSDAWKSLPDPAWSPEGPRNDALPRINRAMREVAVAAGAGVLLSGSGSDELLGAVRYLLPLMLRAGRWRDALSYLRDIRRGGGVRRLATEGLALGAGLLPAGGALRLYWAANWPELCVLQPPAVLGERFRPFVQQWSTDWVRQMLAMHVEHHGSWAVADAWDALFPSEGLSRSGDLPERFPFLDTDFARYVMGLPLYERYSARLRTPYHRAKSLVLRLYPPHLHAALPQAKQRFARALGDYQQGLDEGIERCVDYGLVRPGALAGCRDTMLLWRVHALESWLAGAEAVGATPAE